MVISDVMSREVLTVLEETPLRDVAALLDRNRISGVPVCGRDGRVLGVVSEADILRKEEGHQVDSRWFLWLSQGAPEPEAKIRARTAGEAMTTPAITIAPDLPVAEAAMLMRESGIHRLPVVRDGRLVGIVTRADLVRVFHRPDEEIEREICEGLRKTLWVDPADLSITVEEGVARLAGPVENRSTAALVTALVRCVPGVVDVEAELVWQVDDLSRRVAGARLQHRV